MKQALSPSKNSHQQRGFTLVETAIAMGMVAVMISSFMIVFGPAAQGINKSLSAKEASRFSTALEHELSVLRSGEGYSTVFEKAFEWIRNSNVTAPTSDQRPVLIYQYRGNPGSVRPDGTLDPYTGSGTVAGVDFVIQTSVRRLDDTFHQAEIQAELAPGVLVGKVYYAKMTQMIYNTSGEMVLGTAGEIKDLHPTNTTRTSASAYTDVVIPFRTEFYVLPNVLYSYINATWSPAAPGRLLFTKNMAVNR